jgi:hypothetical protein
MVIGMKVKKIVIAIIVVIVSVFLLNKILIINKYKTKKNITDAEIIFKDKITVENTKKLTENILTIDELSINNYFKDYNEPDENSLMYFKKDKKGNVEGFYFISPMDSYINIFENNKINIFENLKNEDSFKKSVQKYFKKNNIVSDIDLLNYIKKNKYFKSTIFDSVNTIKIKYALNIFINSILGDAKNIILIDGNVNGILADKGDVKLIYLIYNEQKIFQISLAGEEITNDSFINELLETVNFDLN